MKKIKTIYFHVLNYTQENLERLRASCDCIFLDTPTSLLEIPVEQLAEVELLFAPLGWRYDAQLFSKLPRLRAVATNTTGVPHIDLDDAKLHNVRVFSLKDEISFLETITPTAEMTVGLIILLSRNILPASKAVLHGQWQRWDHGGEKMLSRMSIGIVGLGRLGKLVARYAQALGMKVSYFDPYVSLLEENTYCKRDSLQALVMDVDVVSVHVHANKETFHMFDEEVFSHFKKGALFINTARGELVDSQALLSVLENRILAGAAVDVLDGEFKESFQDTMLENPLIQYSQKNHNLIITPHIGGSTKDAWHLTQAHVINQALSFFGQTVAE